MAGLQYYFFPTDFFYPKQQSASSTGENSGQPLVTLQTQKRDFHKSIAIYHGGDNGGAAAKLVTLPPLYKRVLGDGSDQILSS